MLRRDSKVIFISYSHRDSSEFAKKLTGSLREEGFSVFLDVDNIMTGDNWRAKLNDALLDATHFIAVLSPESLISEWCKREIEAAKNQKLPIFPIQYISCDVSQNKDLEPLHHEDFTQSDDNRIYKEQFRKLVSAIIRGGRRLETPIQQWRQFPIMNFATHIDKLKCIPKDTSIAKAYDVIAKNLHFRHRHLVITDTPEKGGRLLGMVSLLALQTAITRGNLKESVSEVMVMYHPDKPNPQVCVWLHEKATLEDALKQFLRLVTHNPASMSYFYMSAIPIIDDNFNIVGIIVFDDILHAMVNGLIPIPNITISEMNYLRDRNLVTAKPEDDPTAIHIQMRFQEFGQRDVPVVDDSGERLIGLVPEYILATNRHHDKNIGEITIPVAKLKLQTQDSTLEDFLKTYLNIDSNESQFYFLPVVKSKNNPELLGLIGYRDIFQALLDLG